MVNFSGYYDRADCFDSANFAVCRNCRSGFPVSKMRSLIRLFGYLRLYGLCAFCNEPDSDSGVRRPNHSWIFPFDCVWQCEQESPPQTATVDVLLQFMPVHNCEPKTTLSQGVFTRLCRQPYYGVRIAARRCSLIVISC